MLSYLHAQRKIVHRIKKRERKIHIDDLHCIIIIIISSSRFDDILMRLKNPKSSRENFFTSCSCTCLYILSEITINKKLFISQKKGKAARNNVKYKFMQISWLFYQKNYIDFHLINHRYFFASPGENNCFGKNAEAK